MENDITLDSVSAHKGWLNLSEWSPLMQKSAKIRSLGAMMCAECASQQNKHAKKHVKLLLAESRDLLHVLDVLWPEN
jgi:hypothetical protein